MAILGKNASQERGGNIHWYCTGDGLIGDQITNKQKARTRRKAAIGNWVFTIQATGGRGTLKNGKRKREDLAR